MIRFGGHGMSLARDVTTVGAATLTSRLLGFLRDAGIAAVLGAGPLSDAYFAALQIPNLFRRLLAEGALNSAYVPLSLRIRDDGGPTATRRVGAEALLAAAMAAAGIAQLLCVGAAWLRLEMHPRRLSLALSPAVRRFLVQAIPGVVAGGIPQLKLMAGAMVASSSQAAVSWLYYANRLYELPLGVISIAISSVLVPAIAASLRRGHHAPHAPS